MSGKERLLITGGLGNLGSWLSEYFSSKYDLFILSKSAKNQLSCSYSLIKADISNIDELKSKLNIEFDYCIHAASYNESFHENYAEKALKINALGTRNLVEVLKDTKIKNFIYLSTFHVYGISSGLINEDSELSPRNDYASTHLFAEYYLKQFLNTHNFQSVILRLTNCYGAPKHVNSSKWYLVLNDLVKSAFEKGVITLNGSGEEVRDLIWMGDVCSAIEDLLISSHSDTYNLSSGFSYKMIFLAEKVKKNYELRYAKNIEIVIKGVDKSKAQKLEVDNNKIRRKIGSNFGDHLEKEIDAIFSLLEGCKELKH